MKSLTYISAALTALINTAAAVTGAAEGFAKGVTGGGSATPVYPSTTAELVSYLQDSQPRVIMLNKEFNFIGTAGRTTATGCAPWGTGSACQLAINANNWCNGQGGSVSVNYDNAAISAITLGSNKSLIGVGNKGVIRGKGLRMVSGAKNIIIQNIHITELNPQYVWGGDAITFNGCDLVWIDHVTTSLIGRQHYVAGYESSGRITISNSKIDGTTSWSASCDGHHYWTALFIGSGDLITFKNNYIYRTSGRAPKLGGNTLFHAVNNYWYDNTGHAFDIDSGGMVMAEGNVFQNVKASVNSGRAGQLFGSPDSSTNTKCASYLGHNCQVNAYGSSPALGGTDTNFFTNFQGKNIASASTAESAKNVANTAGFGKI
ncbi:pectin lyase [Colletotrichum truncatum]|uniref:Pectin lyase n=1 Tax=Colletotrichum truncatum TaxID=5467 RepID=A0ACC3ZKQ6_COLTU|nr:pectin lyase [Colletotrichum truncatum]KAF6800031.1 pectin lyase [Colletotrichum truncatum]